MSNAKAWIGAAVSFLTALLGEWNDAEPVTARDFVVALCAALVAFAAVYATPNRTNG